MFAQKVPEGTPTKVNMEGRVYSALVTEEGDTLILVDLDDISITAMRTFASNEDYLKNRNSVPMPPRSTLMPR